MTTHKSPKGDAGIKPPPRSTRYPGIRGKIVDWAEHIFEDGMLYIRVRFTDKTELCWVLNTAHVIVEADLSDWKTGDCKRLAVYAEGESDWD